MWQYFSIALRELGARGLGGSSVDSYLSGVAERGHPAGPSQIGVIVPWQGAAVTVVGLKTVHLLSASLCCPCTWRDTELEQPVFPVFP